MKMVSSPLPGWLRRKLEEETRSGNNNGLFEMAQAVTGVPEGQRDDQMFRLAGLLRSRGVDRDVAEGVVLAAAAKCDPPFPEEEARQKVENAFRYEPGTPRRIPGTDTTDTADAGHRLRELPEAPPFPVEALPAPCRRLVEEAASAIVCPPEFIAVPLLVTLGAAIGTSRVVRLKGGWTESAAVYAAIVALPGKKKTPALKAATKAAREKQGDYRQEYREAKEEHEAEARQWEADKKTAAKEGEPAPEPPAKPVMKRTVVEDTTVEALAAVLEGNPRGVLVARDELSAFVRSLDQYKNHKGTDRQFYLSAWSNSPVTVDRKNLEEPLFLLKPFVGVVGSIQPGVLSELTANRHGFEGDGFLDRFLFAYPEPMPSRWSDEEISFDAVLGVRTLYDVLLSKLELDYQENGDPEPRAVDLSNEARARFREEADALQEETEQPGFPNVLRGPWSKLEAYLARLALVLAMVRVASAPSHEEERVELEDVEAATVLLHYFKAHARRAYLQLYGERREDRLVVDLTGLLKENLGRWEDDPTKGWEDPASKLFGVLKERSCDALPTRPDELAKEVLALASHIPSLKARRGKRGDERVLRIWVVEPPLPVVSGVRGVRDVRLWGPDDPDEPDDNDPGGGGAPDPEDPDPHGNGGGVPRVPTPPEEPPEADTTTRNPVVVSEGPIQSDFNLLADSAEMPALVEEIEAAEVVALDLETTGLDSRRHETRLLSLATERRTWVVDVFATDPAPVLEALRKKTLVIHNAAFDLLFLRHFGYVHRGRVTDTMILSRMVHAGERDAAGKRLDHSLEACCKRELGLDLDKTHQKADWSGDLSEEMLRYATEDAQVLLLLHEALAKKIREQGQERAGEIEERTLPAVIEMAHAGVPVDKDRWLQVIDEAREQLKGLRAPLDALVGTPPEEVRKKNTNNKNIPAERKDKWNWDSREQVKAVAKSVGLKLQKTSMDHLKRANHDLARALLSYKEARGNLETYSEKFFEPTKEGREVYTDGRIYPSWKVCEADTGRMSCAEPNMQNIPSKSRLRELRTCVVAPEGRVLVVADYSQIELRVAAKVAGEEAMLEAYREGKDLHGMTARSVTGREEISEGERKLAKAVNFGLIFGQGAEGLRNYARNSYGVEMSLSQAESYRERFFEAYPAVRTWHRKEGKSFDAGDKTARSLTGRRRRVGRFTEKVNHPVQGTAADGMKMALALLWERRDECPGAVPILAVHDEIVVECDEGEAEKVEAWLKKAMRDGMDAVVNVTEPHVPIEVEARVSQTWGD